VRSPLVYGPGVKANFLSLIRLVDRGLPLPFADIRNERSIIFTENLADLLLECAASPAASGETFLASEGPPLSTPELIRTIANELGKPARLFGVPPAVLNTLCRMTGQSRLAERLLSSFAVDGSRAHRLLNWSPPVSPSAGLRETMSWYQSVSLE
jgi:nucleoside-diphosphate-sugar epimerase